MILFQQFDAVITAAKSGQAVDLSEMPPSLKDAPMKQGRLVKHVRCESVRGSGLFLCV